MNDLPVPHSKAARRAVRVGFRHDWFQSTDFVNVTIMAKNQPEENVQVTIAEDSLTVEIRLEGAMAGSSYLLDLELFAKIDVAQSSFRHNKYKIEVKLRKAGDLQWPALERADDIAMLMAAGMNVARFNFSHGEYSWFEEVIGIIRDVKRQKKRADVAIALDTKGPEIRTGHHAKGTPATAGEPNLPV